MILDVVREKNRLDHIFSLVGQGGGEDELLAHWAKYLCVLTSGFLENSLRIILLTYVSKHANPTVVNYIETRIKSLTNINDEKVGQLLGSFNAEWRDRFLEKRTVEQKDAIDSVVANRHLIAHGRAVSITMARIKQYYADVVAVINIVDEHCVNR